MHLTINEIVYLLNTWNSWYLIEHDNYLKSDSSENGVDISIFPFDSQFIEQEVVDDLKDYTDHLTLDKPGIFQVSFLFSAWEHQPAEIFNALKLVLEKAEGSKIEINNYMNFIETDLPDEKEMLGEMDEAILEELQKYKQNQDKDRSDETLAKNGEEIGKANSDKSEDTGEIIPPHNRVEIRGTIGKNYVEIEEILHNKEPFPNLPLFLEAARLYETVESNFQPPEGITGISPFECTSEKEASLVSLILGTCTDFRPRLVKGSTIETGASPEELAAVVSYVRYKNDFKLFNNPFKEKLSFKRKKRISSTREMLYKSCSCLGLGLLILLSLLIWLLFQRNK